MRAACAGLMLLLLAACGNHEQQAPAVDTAAQPVIARASLEADAAVAGRLQRLASAAIACNSKTPDFSYRPFDGVTGAANAEVPPCWQAFDRALMPYRFAFSADEVPGAKPHGAYLVLGRDRQYDAGPIYQTDADGRMAVDGKGYILPVTRPSGRATELYRVMLE